MQNLRGGHVVGDIGLGISELPNLRDDPYHNTIQYITKDMLI